MVSNPQVLFDKKYIYWRKPGIEWHVEIKSKIANIQGVNGERRDLGLENEIENSNDSSEDDENK